MDAVVEHINSSGKAFVDFALAMLIQSTALVVLLLMLDLLLRDRIRASIRYCLWMLVFVQLLLPASPTVRMLLRDWFGVPGDSTAVTQSRLTWQGGVFFAWLLIEIVFAVWLLVRALRNRRVVAGAGEVNAFFSDILTYCSECMGVETTVRLKVSDEIQAPGVCGLFRPVILLPMNISPFLNSRHLRTILLHELGHIRRYDLWFKAAQTLLCSLYFYNPLLWLITGYVRRIREQAVDETVLAAMAGRAKWYPETLLSIARRLLGRPALGLGLMGLSEYRLSRKRSDAA